MLPHLLEVLESLQHGVGEHNAACKNSTKTLTCKWLKSGLHSPCPGSLRLDEVNTLEHR
jgi:hypothetical protein